VWGWSTAYGLPPKPGAQPPAPQPQQAPTSGKS